MTSHAHELMNKFTGPHWIGGGTVTLRFIRPVLPGDVIIY